MYYIPLCTYDNYIEAHIVMGRLEKENIRCCLQDENTVTLSPFLSNAMGGIKLMVAAVQAQRALQILTGSEKQPEDLSAFPS